MKLSYEKVLQLARRITGAIEELNEVEIFEEPNTIRQEVVRILNDLLLEEEKIGAVVKLRISSQKRTIAEGGAEWEILYRKYYADEMHKLGSTSKASSHT
jgi:uncharacterized protein